MIEPSLRNLPPPVPSRDSIYGHSHRNQQLHHGHRHYQVTDAEQEHMERTGDCMVILPFSRSAFRGSQNGTSKCECDSFFMSPGDPGACLCGHPASCHSPRPAGSENSSTESSPSMLPMNHGYLGSPQPLPRPPSPRTYSQTYGDQVHQKADANSLHNRVSKLERLLSSEVYARHLLENNTRFLYTSFKRLSEHCRLLSQEVELIITKSGDAAREALDLEVINLRQKKMVEDMEKLNAAIEGLDERTEDLEFRNEDLEKWVEEEKEERKGRAKCDACLRRQGDSVDSGRAQQKQKTMSNEVRTNHEDKIAPPADSPLTVAKPLGPSPSPMLKRKHSFFDAGPATACSPPPSNSSSDCEDGQPKLMNYTKRQRH